MTDASAGSTGRSKWVTGIAWLLGGNLIATAITVVVGVLIARVLGPKDFGIYNLVVVAISFVATITTFRLDMHLVSELGRSDGEAGPGGDEPTIYLRALRATYVLAVPVVVAAVIAAAVLGGAVGAFILLGALEVLVSPWLLGRAVLQVRMQQKFQVFAATAGRLVWAGSIVAIVWSNAPNPIAWILGARVVSLVLEGALIARVARLPNPLRSFHFGSITEELRVLRQALPLLLAGMAGTLYNRIDQPLIAAMKGAAQTGLYGAAVRIAELPSVIPALVQNVSQPPMVRAYKEGATERFKAAVTDSMVFMMLPVGLAVSILVGVGDKVAVMLLGQAYEGLGPVIQALAIAEIGVCLGATLSSAALAAGRRGLLLKATLCGLAVNLVANLLLIPGFGATGAAWGSVAGYGASALFTALGDRELRSLGSGVWSVTLKGCALVAIAGAVAVWLRRDFTVALPAATVVYMVAAAVFFPKEASRAFRAARHLAAR